MARREQGVVEGQARQLRRGNGWRRPGRIGAFCRAIGRAVPPISLIVILGTIGYLARPTVYVAEDETNLATLEALHTGLGGQNQAAGAPSSTVPEDVTVTQAALEESDDHQPEETDPGQTSGVEQPNDRDKPGPVETGAKETGIEEAGGEGIGAQAGTERRGSPACFELILREDFDGPLGPDWQVYDSAGNHSAHAIRRAEAVTVEDGKLVITARNGEDGVAASGGIRHVVGQRYGKYSFSVRTDPDVSNATSGVVLTWPVSESQPLDGENNMYETLRVPGDRSRFYSFIHKPFDEAADGISQNRFIHRGDATQWQEVMMEWAPDYVEVAWTNPATGTTRTRRIEEGPEDLITDAEHFLAIQLDLFKGSFPDDRAVQMEVDWVEVYSYCG